MGDIDGFDEALRRWSDGTALRRAAASAAAADFILEGLCALRKISRTEGGQLFASPPRRRARERAAGAALARTADGRRRRAPRGRKKKYFN